MTQITKHLSSLWMLLLLAITAFAVPILNQAGVFPLTPQERLALRAGVIGTPTFNPVMSGVATRFMQDSAGFVGLRLFPAFNTALQAANYYVFDKSNMLDTPTDLRRAQSSVAKRIAMKLSSDTYSTKEYMLEGPVDDRERRKYQNQFDLDAAVVRRVLSGVMLNHEIRVHDLVTNTSLIPNSSPSIKWDGTNPTPIQDVDVAREAIHSATGLEANTMVVSRSTFNVLKELSVILDKIKYTERGIVTPDLLAAVFGVQRFIVAGGLINTANEGQALTIASLWGDDVVLAHVETAQDLMAPNFGRTFVWTESQVGAATVKTYRDDPRHSDIHNVQQDTDEKLVGAEAGYLLSNVLTA